MKKGKKLAKKVVGDDLIEQVQEQVSEKISSVDWGDTVEGLKEKGLKCAAASRETIEICDATESKREQMIRFASEIQSTLTNLKGSNDASILETIKELTDGSKIRDAMELAKGLDEAALKCVDKSVEMMDLMEDGMESLPEMVQTALESMAGESDDDDDDDDEEKALLDGLDRDMEDVKTCVQAIKDLNLATALKVGVQAFTQLTDKAVRSKSLFVSVRGFATDVQEITDTFSEMKYSQFTAKGKDMMRCIGLCEVMRQVAQGAGKLLKLLISLFEMTADRISQLWASLSFAKDCMQDSVEIVDRARTLCLDAKGKSNDLITKSRSIHDKLESVGTLNRQSVKAVKELTHGGEIQAAIELVKTMDDEVIECADKMTGMIEKVTEGFKNFPPILTDGMDMEAVGRKEEDPEPLDVEKDVSELDESRQAIEDSDFITVVVAGKKGFEGVSSKATICEDTLGLVEEFAGTCKRTIDSFMSVWDLESATQKLEEMCRIAMLGDLMKQFSQQVKKLLLAILALLNTALDKLTHGMPDFPEGVQDAVEAAQDGMEHAVDSAKEQLDDAIDFAKDAKNKFKGKMKFWK